MFFGYLVLLTALANATAAAWFAIVGIMSIFAGLPMYALAMGVVVEASKVVGVSWLYRNWHHKTKIKYMLLPVVIVAMLLTSMGIFGLLSKAHVEQAAPVGNNTAKIERLDQRIAREQARITDSETVTEQLDTTVKTLLEYDKVSGPDGARAVRDGQQEQRDMLARTINEAQDKISEYEDEKMVLGTELRNLEVEVGPVKYLAALVYDDPQSNMEKAVRWVIIAFVFVFDPMAILLLMAANHTLMVYDPKHAIREDDDPDDPDPKPEPKPQPKKLKPNATSTFVAAKPEEPKKATPPEPVSEKVEEPVVEQPEKPKPVANHGIYNHLLKKEGRR
jgi:hypothetical protein